MYVSRRLGAFTGIVLVCLVAASPCWAANETESQGDGDQAAPQADQAAPPAGPQAQVPKSDLAKGLIALSAALAVGLCAIATGIAQSRIGSAGCGTLAEKPDTAGTIILLVAIPETMVILGFVVAVVLLFAA